MKDILSSMRDAIPLIYLGTRRALRDHLPGARYSLLRPLMQDIDRDLRDPSQTIRVSPCKCQNSLATMPQERDYSHRTTVQKLGVKPEPAQPAGPPNQPPGRRG